MYNMLNIIIFIIQIILLCLITVVNNTNIALQEYIHNVHILLHTNYCLDHNLSYEVCRELALDNCNDALFLYQNQIINHDKESIVSILINKGIILSYLGKYLESAMIYRQVLDNYNSKSIIAIANLAAIESYLGNVVESDALYKLAIDIDPLNGVLYYNYGLLVYNYYSIIQTKNVDMEMSKQLKHWNEEYIISLWKQAVIYQPTLYQAYNNLAIISTDINDINLYQRYSI